MKTGKPKSQILPFLPPGGARLLADAERTLTQGQVEQAVPMLQKAVAADPRSAAAQGLLAIALVMQGDAASALAPAQAAVDLRPDDTRAWFTLGRAHKDVGDLEQAVAAYQRALALNPGYAEAHVSLGIALSAQDDFDGAIAAYQRALQIKPGLSVAHANLANALAARAERAIQAGNDAPPDDEALAAQARACEIDPGNALLHRNHGMMLSRAQKRIEAAGAFERALALDNHDVESCLRLADCLRSVGDTVLARELFEKFMSLNPPNAAVMRAFSSWLTRGGLVDEALDWGRKAVALDPDPQTLVQMCGALLQARRQPEALAMGRRAIEASNKHFNFYPVLLLGTNYLSEDPQEVIELHADFGRQLPPPAKARPPWRPRQPGQKLKIGYLSGDFIRHSVSSFIGGLLEQHDRSQFEIYLYHNRGYSDAVTEHFKSLGHHWFDCDGLSDDALYRQITSDGVDILVDLAGHTENSRVFLFAMAPAPVQVAYLGYPTVSGVPANQFRITDHVIDPGDAAAIVSDEPLALARSMFCFRPDSAPVIGAPPEERNGHLTFGSFNNIAKVTEHTLSLWAAALNAVPGSRLLLKSGAMAQLSNRQSIERFMAERGISADRLTLTAWIADKGGHLNLYNEVDVALDPYPYNGATTTCEALWMGVPVISRRGRTHTSRMGASILTAVGKTGWIADDDEAFALAAAQVAADAAGRKAWREQARQLLPQSELFDEAGFVRSFEQLLLQAWDKAGLQLQLMQATAAAPSPAV